ncbi:FluG domain protein [Penicillium bovifimosum]|uniref:FluG domain protein n=1 Tax=Penicillium bovifimosum TaxID=126998 RepID=A0A9W9GJ36_9EURO|nr:FluG domain protein [Penicillium bovifimosum]KAJ5120779.1 FluG domain protein [Penicillium bovifimosum]
MSRKFPYEIGRNITMKLVYTTLTDEYELNIGAKAQPLVNIDDLLFTVYHLLAFSNLSFPIFRYLFQLNTLRKMMTSISVRPGTLVESLGYIRHNDTLKYKDIELYIVKDPKDLKG